MSDKSESSVSCSALFGLASSIPWASESDLSELKLHFPTLLHIGWVASYPLLSDLLGSMVYAAELDRLREITQSKNPLETMRIRWNMAACPKTEWPKYRVCFEDESSQQGSLKSSSCGVDAGSSVARKEAHRRGGNDATPEERAEKLQEAVAEVHEAVFGAAAPSAPCSSNFP